MGTLTYELIPVTLKEEIKTKKLEGGLQHEANDYCLDRTGYPAIGN